MEDTSGSHVVQPACSASVCCTSFDVLDVSRNRIMNTQMLLKRPRSILETSSNGGRMSHILFKCPYLPPQCCALLPYFGDLRHKACAAAQGPRLRLGPDLTFSFGCDACDITVRYYIKKPKCHKLFSYNSNTF